MYICYITLFNFYIFIIKDALGPLGTYFKSVDIKKTVA